MNNKKRNFQFKIDAEITNIFFFESSLKPKDDEFLDEDDKEMVIKNEIYLKKNYLYIKKNNTIHYRNLWVNKKSNSTLSRKIFKDYLIPKIKKERKVKFRKSYFKNLITKLIEDDINNATIRYKVNPADTYKNPSQIQAQIAKEYGAGIHFLIPNKKVGVGKSTKKLCTVEDFNKHNLRVDDLELSGVFKELEYFTEKEQKINLRNFI